MGNQFNRHEDLTSESESDGEGSESDGSEMNISWLFAESSAIDTSVGSDEEGRLEQLQVEYALQDVRIDEAFQSALTEVQSMAEWKMNKLKTEFKAELNVLRDREVELIGEAMDRDAYDAEQLKTPVKAEIPPLGARVVVDLSLYGRHLGTVRYSGETHFGGGPWIGVELDKPKGYHNGTCGGHQYFNCEKGHGMFVIPESILWSKPPKQVEVEEVPVPKPSRSEEVVLTIEC